MTYDTLIIAPFKEMLEGFIGFLPTLFALSISLTILAIGWLIAKVFAKLVVHVLRSVKFDSGADAIGLTGVLKTGGVKDKPSNLMGCITYWVMMIMVLMTTLKSFGVTVVDGSIATLFSYIPHVLLGAFTLIIGMLLAKVVSSLVYITAKNTDMPIPDTLKELTKFAIVIYVSIIYLKEVGLIGLFGGTHYTILMMGVVFAVSLAFGLAGKDVATKYLSVFKK